MRQRGVVIFTGYLWFYAAIWLMAPYSMASAQAPTEAVVYVDRALLAYEAQQYEQALHELQEALRLDPDNLEALYYQGLVSVALGRLPDAQAIWERALTLHPNDLDIAYQLGTLYFGQRQYDQAAPLLQQVYAAEPRRLNLGYYLGFLAYREKQYRRALEYLRANVPSDENYAQLTRFYAGLALGALGLPQQARAEIEEALQLQPLSPLTIPAQRFGEALTRAAERERRFHGELRVGLFYDTNVPVVPNASSDLVAVILRQDQKRRGSEGELGALTLAYTWLKTLDWEGTVSYRFLQTYNNRLPNFNVQDHTPTLGITHRGLLRDMPYFARLQLAYDFITLGDRKFTQRWILNPSLSLYENAGNLTTLVVGLQVKDFFDDHNLAAEEVRDGVNYSVGPVHFLLFEEGRHYIKTGYQFDYDATEGDNWRYAGHHFLFGAQYTLPWGGVRLRYDLDFHLRFHTDRHSLLPVTAPGTVHRRDREAIHLFSIAKDVAWRAQPLTIALEYLIDDNYSNLDAYDYDRQVVTTSLTWRF
ncbi:MAG TPA: tetratricopeptide repeat protein [Alphaproteobacteria bacterium]|nr:tetratricopeptide repeat protein [Alphaproteobacteria bacterium]